MKTSNNFLSVFIILILVTNISKAQSWSLTGNSGINGKINFIGTTDANTLSFRVNNEKSGFLGYDPSSGATAFGYHSLYKNAGGHFNSGFGYSSLSANTTGKYNTGIGTNTLRKNIDGSYNTAIGTGALSGNISGMNNTAVGSSALYFSSTGSNNIAIGNLALYNNHSGCRNVAIGNSTLFYSSTAHDLVAIGDSALMNNKTGYSNTAVGSKALFTNKSGAFNTALGINALTKNTEGHYNTALGAYALGSNIKGEFNIAVGEAALFNNKEGHFNTALGNNALQYNTTGSHNTAIGFHSMYNGNTGMYNTAVGEDAGYNSPGETYCTYLGYNAGKGGGLNKFTNSMALGNGARYTESNYIAVGNTAIKAIKGQVSFTTFSDGRFKKDIQENVPGLRFINKLKPVTYHLNATDISKFLNEDENINDAEKSATQNILQKAREEKEKIVYTGFIAQDVERAAKELNYDFSGVDKPENENSLYGLRYAEFVVPLVKAVQELSKMNDAKDSRIKDLKTEIAELKSELQKIKAMVSSSRSSLNSQLATSISSASLSQNTPNPFTNTTTINYTLPPSSNSTKIIITDKTGKTVKHINLNGNGRGSLKIDASLLAGGIYTCSLYVNNLLIESKQMEHFR